MRYARTLRLPFAEALSAHQLGRFRDGFANGRRLAPSYCSRNRSNDAIRPSLAEHVSMGTRMWYEIPHTRRARRSLRFMPKRGTDAASRCFFDELLSLDAARLRATGVIRFEDRHGVIAFGDGVERRKCIGVAHTKFPNGGWWTYLICPRCGGRKKKLWLVDDTLRSASKWRACRAPATPSSSQSSPISPRSNSRIVASPKVKTTRACCAPYAPILRSGGGPDSTAGGRQCGIGSAITRDREGGFGAALFVSASLRAAVERSPLRSQSRRASIEAALISGQRPVHRVKRGHAEYGRQV